jgi:hypothetical protein
MSLVRPQQLAEVLFPSDRSDEPLRTSICHGDRGAIGPDAHRTNTPDQKVAINPVLIANDVLRCLCPGVRLGELAGDPFGTRMRGHIDPTDHTATMLENQKPI